ncbi:MAG: hypothetical protein LBT32_06390 [Peptococcaceae bacterium]|nr:hypothetical protein [Peptococcaceae bacterium]
MERTTEIPQLDLYPTRGQIANGLGVDKNTVNKQREKLESRGEIPHAETTIDTLARIQPRERKPAAVSRTLEKATFKPSETFY